jgi:hypothetical protein
MNLRYRKNSNGHRDMSYGKWRGAHVDPADIQVRIALVLAAVAALLSTSHAQAIPWEQMRSLAIGVAAAEMAVMTAAIAENPAPSRRPDGW